MIRIHQLFARATIAVFVSVVATTAYGATLMPAPVFDAPQDIAKGSRTKGAVRSFTRGEVSGLYYSMYRRTATVDPQWHGDVAGCAEDRTSEEYIAATLTRINFYRLLAGLPADVTHHADGADEDTQKAALIMSANGQLSHSPPASWQCHTAEGGRAAGRSNLALGVAGLRAIDLYMDDFGAYNAAVGHRRWILYPPQTTMSSGAIPRGSHSASNALWVIGNFGNRPPTPDGVAWPPAGFLPYDLLPSGSNRWSFSYPGADFSDATVTMSLGEDDIPTTLEPIYNGYGDNTLVWLPRRSSPNEAGVSYTRPGDDITYHVVISNVLIAGETRQFEYDVTVFEPGEEIFGSSFE